MKLTSLLTINQIKPDMKATNGSEAIEELLAFLVDKKIVDAGWQDEIAASLYLRENKLSTGVGDGIAIPHAFSEKVTEVVAVFGRSKRGIDFMAQDHLPVHFVVMFISPKQSYQKHLLTLAAIARFFTKSDTREKLLKATSAEQLHNVFRLKNVEID